MRHILLVTVTNYLGSTQFYLTQTHLRILICIITLSALSVVAGVGAFVWLAKAHNDVFDQAQSWSQMNQQLEQQNQQVLAMEQRVRKLQGILGTQVDEHFDINLIPQMKQKTQTKRTLLTLIPNSWPVAQKSVVTSSYGQRLNPITGLNQMHKGIDIQCVQGAPVLATANGVVARSIKAPGFGNIVTLTNGYGFSSRYAHLQKRLVKRGEFVYKDQVIGLCGSTGSSTAPHLHYEILFLEQQKNPWPFINWGLSNFDGIFKQVKELQWQSLIKPAQLKTSKQQQ